MDVILGPPGTGKTTALLAAVEAELARGTPPERVAYVSFTRRAAEEAVARACAKFDFERAQLPYFRTIHSLCFRALGMRSDDVLAKFLPELGSHVGIKFTGRWSDDGTFTGYDLGDRILMMCGLAAARCSTLREQFDRDDDDLPWSRVEEVARAIDEFKRARGLMDYNDMLAAMISQGLRPRLDFMAVDEAQDQTRLQWRVVDHLAVGCPQVCVAGDDDQAIFRWAGADVDRLVDMEASRVRVLGQSWRVPQAVQAVAQSIIAVVQHRRPKKWAPRLGDSGVVSCIQHLWEADLGSDVLVLARNSYVLGEQVEPHLRSEGVLYERDGHPSIRAAYLLAITSWEQLRRGEAVPGSEARAIYAQMTSGRGVARGHKALPNFHDEDQVAIGDLVSRGGLLTQEPWFMALDRLPPSEVSYMRQALRRGEKLRERPRVRLSTIHGSKGGEADHVILLKEMAARTFREMDGNEEDEARVWYVGATRARRQLTIVDSTTARACPWL